MNNMTLTEESQRDSITFNIPFSFLVSLKSLSYRSSGLFFPNVSEVPSNTLTFLSYLTSQNSPQLALFSEKKPYFAKP